MALIIRIDVDRPYGREPMLRHVLSRFSSDCYLPTLQPFGFLRELETMLTWLNDAGARAYAFFRRCTLPSARILELLQAGGHEIGLHLENSRSFETFLDEKQHLERHTGAAIRSFSKHGSGGARFGRSHYAPYEPDRYVEWATRAGLRLFLGNLQNPALPPSGTGNGSNTVVVFPSAFWLEPHWRDTRAFSCEWLVDNAVQRDIVLLVHPENVLADAGLTASFRSLISNIPSRIIQ
jgi:hypothetical protein